MAGQWQQVQVAGAAMPVYVSSPDGPGPFPAMVVIHHAPGVDEFVQETADRLAGEGYTAIAPDLFHRITDEMVESSGKTRRDLLSDPEIVADVNATVEFLSAHPSVDSERLGITGFCMGGRVTWLATATNSAFKAAAPFYGGNILVPWGDSDRSPFELSPGISCPVLFHFGEEDANPSPGDMRKLDDELSRQRMPHQFYSYPGADHAFMNRHNLARYHRRSAEMAWARTREFLAAHLDPAPVAP